MKYYFQKKKFHKSYTQNSKKNSQLNVIELHFLDINNSNYLANKVLLLSKKFIVVAPKKIV